MSPKPFSHNSNKTLQIPSTHIGRPDFTMHFPAEVAAVSISVTHTQFGAGNPPLYSSFSVFQNVTLLNNNSAYKMMKRFAGSAHFVYKDKAEACKQGTECHMDRGTSLNVLPCINSTAKLMQDCLYC